MSDIMLRDYQESCIRNCMNDLKEHNKLAIVMPTGCLSGDTMIGTSRNGTYIEYRIDHLFNALNNNPEKIKHLKGFNKKNKIKTMVRSFNGETIRRHEALKFISSGMKEVFLLELENGKKIKATSDHKIMTANGWTEMRHLSAKDLVMCDNKTVRPSGKPYKNKIKNKQIGKLWFHPFAKPRPSNKKSKTIEEHRAIYEAHINDLTVDDYTKILTSDKIKSSKLKFIDPKTHAIHHINGNHNDNRIENLACLSRSDHAKIHKMNKNFNQGIPEYSRPLSAPTYVGEEKTYDIQCAAPHHNFVANGIVVHNSGKTEVFIEIAKRYRFSFPNAGSVLVLSHLDILTKQTADRFALRAPDLKTGVLQGMTRPSVMDKVVISTMQSSRVKDKASYLDERLLKKVGLIIIDEAHYIETESYQKVLSYWPEAKVIGCTATPFRGNAIMTNFFDKVSYSISLGELIERGFIVRPELYAIQRTSQELTDVMANLVSLYKERELGKSAIVFMKTKDDCRSLRNVFQDSGITAEVVTCNTRGEYRDSVIADFNSGKTKVLVTVNVLTAGFDSPVVQSIWMPYSVASVTQYIQRIGRGLRLCPSLNKDHCNIYVFGSAPSISKRLYERIHNASMLGGKIKEYEKVTDTLDLNEWSLGEYQERYIWTKTVAEAVRKMEKLGMSSLSEMLNKKDFPKRFLENITNLLARLPSSKTSLPNGNQPVTQNQRSLLKRFSFEDRQIDKINKAEASMMITAIVGKVDKDFTIKIGRFAGRHVSELPYAYRAYVLKNMPTSEVATLIRRWNDANPNHQRNRKTS